MLLRLPIAPAAGCAAHASTATVGCCAAAAAEVAFPRTAAAQPRFMPAVVTAAMALECCLCWW